MVVKRQKKKSPLIIGTLMSITSYATLRVMSLAEQNGKLEIGHFMEVANTIYKLNTPLILNQKTLYPALIVCVFTLMCYMVYQDKFKKNIQEDTYGSAEWGEPKELKPLQDPVFEQNKILTATEFTAQDMKLSQRSRNLVLIGRPSTGKSRYHFKPNILNAVGTIVCTDPKGEILQDCGTSLLNKGYTIKVLNLDKKWISNSYNPFMYIKKVPKDAYAVESLLDTAFENERLADDDVMKLINVIIKNTQSENIKQTSGDPFWEKAEIVFLQSVIYYMLSNYPKEKQNFTTVMELMRLAEPKGDSPSSLDRLFFVWEQKAPNHVGVKQYAHFKVAAGNSKMLSTIILTATARLSMFNISEIAQLTDIDTMELDRIGMPGEAGKIAYFIITKPTDTTFNFIANIMYCQVFSIIDANASDNYGSLATPCELYMDEWAQLGEIPLFLEMLAYVRGLNCGVTVGLQSLSQVKKIYKDNWETLLDCCDYVLFLGSRSKETLEYMSQMLGKKTWYKKSSGQTYSRQRSNSSNWDVVGRELATVDELSRMPKGKCVLLIAGFNPFYSDLYDLKHHPRYEELFEPWDADRTMENKYDHLEHLRMDEDDKAIHEQFHKLGLPFVKFDKELKMQKITSYELNKIEKDIILSTDKNIFELLHITN